MIYAIASTVMCGCPGVAVAALFAATYPERRPSAECSAKTWLLIAVRRSSIGYS